LLQKQSLQHNVYHISAGSENSWTCKQLSAYIDGFYRRKSPLHLIKPEFWTINDEHKYITTARQRRLYATLQHYLPFLNMNVTFSTQRLRDELGESSSNPSEVGDYMGQLLEQIDAHDAELESVAP
jgi:hypothetical protein